MPRYIFRMRMNETLHVPIVALLVLKNRAAAEETGHRMMVRDHGAAADFQNAPHFQKSLQIFRAYESKQAHTDEIELLVLKRECFEASRLNSTSGALAHARSIISGDKSTAATWWPRSRRRRA
jgi:hypothetical protein